MFTFLLGYLNRHKAQPVAMAQDPWGNNNDNKNNDQPPDLDELFNKLLRRNPRRSGSNNGGDSGNPAPYRLPGKLILLVLAVAFIGWLGSGVYTVRERENGVETFLGRYARTTKAGLNWHVPAPFGQVTKVDVTSISSFNGG